MSSSNFSKHNPLQKPYRTVLRHGSCNYTKASIQQNFTIKKPFLIEVDGQVKPLDEK